MRKRKTKLPASSPQTPRRVTLRDIAQEVGVSHVSVSKALRNSPEISEPMRKRIKLHAEKVGYTPDPMLSALSHYRLTSKTKPVKSVLAWLNPWSKPEDMRKQREFSLYWEGALDTAQRMGFLLEEFSSQKTPLKRLEGIFKTRNIQGILIPPHHDPNRDSATADFHGFHWQEFASVRFGRTAAYPKTHFVTAAQTSNTIQAFNKILKNGYERIGFVSAIHLTRLFFTGYHMAQLTSKTNQLKPLFFEQSQTQEQQAISLSNWFQTEKPDAIITDLDRLPMLLEKLRIKVPEDVALATTSIHDTPIDSGIDQKPKEIGRAATRLLITLLNEQQVGIPETCNEVLIQGKWTDGKMMPPKSRA
ncbi:LacI family transcriptional regulator [Puniceicoccaceae bacterium K14]|nr:LacI family transcriptional regulator [Puniceicoccaceae bacterium K14]